MSWTVIVSVSIYLLFLVVLVKSYVSAFWGYIFPADVIFYLLFQILLYKQCKLRYKTVFCTFVCTVFDGKQETVERPMDRGRNTVPIAMPSPTCESVAHNGFSECMSATSTSLIAAARVQSRAPASARSTSRQLAWGCTCVCAASAHQTHGL